MRFYSIVYSLGLKTLNVLGDDLEEESSNEDQITEMIKEIGKYNNMTHFSFFILIIENLRLWDFAYKQAFFDFRCTSKAIEES